MSNNQRKVQEQFGKNANAYVTSSVHAKGTSLERLVELIHPSSNWRMLDVSTGGGHTALKFAPLVAVVVASDITPEMLNAAEKFISGQNVTNVEFKLADAQDLPFCDGDFDLVTNRIALHHYPDALRAVREMARVLKPGGLIGFVDNVVPPNKQAADYINAFEKLRDFSHHWCFSLEQLEQMFTKSGLKIEHTESSRKKMNFEDWANRMGCPPDLKKQLQEQLERATSIAGEFLNPRMEDGRLWFDLEEAILIARK